MAVRVFSRFYLALGADTPQTNQKRRDGRPYSRESPELNWIPRCLELDILDRNSARHCFLSIDKFNENKEI